MAIKRTEAYFASNDTLNRVRVLIWQDTDQPVRGVVQIAHGVAEHIGRYDGFARFLAKAGFAVCGNDHLGHGKTAPTVSELGFVEPGADVFMAQDMHTLSGIMRRRFPGAPYYLFGHSMGSLLARVYMAQCASELSGAILCGTLQLPDPVLLLGDPVGALMDRLPEQFTMGDLANAAFGRVTARILKDDDPLAWISKNKENLVRWREDPLCGFSIGNDLARALVSLAVKAGMPGAFRRLPAGFPVMLISGGRDPVGFFGRGVIAVADRLMGADIVPEVILYPGDRHEILNEEDCEKVYADVLRFLNAANAGGIC